MRADKIVLTVKNVAERAGVSVTLVYDWVASGMLTRYRMGRAGSREGFESLWVVLGVIVASATILAKFKIRNFKTPKKKYRACCCVGGGRVIDGNVAK